MKTDVRLIFAIVALWTALAVPACAGGAVPPAVDQTIGKLDDAVAHLQGLPDLFAAQLKTCAGNVDCENAARGSWAPVIEGMEILHSTYCSAHQGKDPGCEQ